MRRCFPWLLISLGLAGCQSNRPAPADIALDAVLAKMNERLGMMEAVARHKYRNGMPTADASREEAMLRGLEAKA